MSSLGQHANVSAKLFPSPSTDPPHTKMAHENEIALAPIPYASTPKSHTVAMWRHRPSRPLTTSYFHVGLGSLATRVTQNKGGCVWAVHGSPVSGIGIAASRGALLVVEGGVMVLAPRLTRGLLATKGAFCG